MPSDRKLFVKMYNTWIRQVLTSNVWVTLVIKQLSNEANKVEENQNLFLYLSHTFKGGDYICYFWKNTFLMQILMAFSRDFLKTISGLSNFLLEHFLIVWICLDLASLIQERSRRALQVSRKPFFSFQLLEVFFEELFVALDRVFYTTDIFINFSRTSFIYWKYTSRNHIFILTKYVCGSITRFNVSPIKYTFVTRSIFWILNLIAKSMSIIGIVKTVSNFLV